MADQQFAAGADDWVAPPPVQPTGQHDAGIDDWIAAPKETARTPSLVPSDIARGAGRGLLEGVTSVAGLPADIADLGERASRWAVVTAAQKMGLISPEHAAAYLHRNNELHDYLGSSGLSRAALAGAEKAGVPLEKPSTPVGEMAETAASFLPGATSLGAKTIEEIPGALLKYGVIPGVTSEAAGQATKGTSAEPYARVAGAVVPGLLTAGTSVARELANPMREAASLTPAQEAAAQALLAESRASGAPLTVPEAVQAVTGSATRLGDIQRVVEQSPRGAAITRPFFAKRPQQVQSLGEQVLNQMAAGAPNPYEVAPRVQGAAAGVVSETDKARTAAVKPLYQSAATDVVPVDDMEAFLGKIDKMIAADKTGLTSPELVRLRDALTEAPARTATSMSPAQPRVPITDINNLDTARKYFRDRISQPAVAQDAVPKQVGAKVGTLLDDLRDLMETNSGDFAAARQKYQQITNDVVNPLLRSPTGQLAAAETFPKQAQILFNPNPLPNSEAAVGNAVRQIARTDPDAAAQMVRLHLERTFNEATQANLPGANQFGGPKFAAVVSGNSQQARNLEAAVRALPDGDTRWGALKKGLDIMQAMGTRQPVGSQTEFNRQINEFLKSGKPMADMAATAATPARWTTMARDIYRNFAYGRNTANFARVFTEGDVADLRLLSGVPTRSLKGQAALIGLLAREGSASGQQSTQQQP